MPMPWYKSHKIMLHDPTVQGLPLRVFKGFMNLTWATDDDGFLPDSIKATAYLLHVRENAAHKLLDELLECGLIEVVDDVGENLGEKMHLIEVNDDDSEKPGEKLHQTDAKSCRFRVSNWEVWHGDDNTSTERSRTKRAKDKEKAQENATPMQRDATGMQRDATHRVEESREDRDEDGDREEEKEEKRGEPREEKNAVIASKPTSSFLTEAEITTLIQRYEDVFTEEDVRAGINAILEKWRQTKGEWKMRAHRDIPAAVARQYDKAANAQRKKNDAAPRTLQELRASLEQSVEEAL